MLLALSDRSAVVLALKGLEVHSSMQLMTEKTSRKEEERVAIDPLPLVSRAFEGRLHC
jgi:hypothetical protein